MTYTVHQAKTNLSRLIKEAQNGKEVVIARGKQPVANRTHGQARQEANFRAKSGPRRMHSIR
jgi:antitoxin (DNA-binding transcriptional repressor) of toxin-antitoxin stability system